MHRILFGDNQFFGVNHMSEDKAKLQMMQFAKIEAVMATLNYARDAGIGGFMCTTHDRIAEVAAIVRKSPENWQNFDFYPCMPYAHKYANAVTELGYFDAIKKFIPNSGIFDTALRGSKALLSRDMASLATLLVDAEMKAFAGLSTPVIFVQNVVTDLILGLGCWDAFGVFSDHVRKKYRAEAGFITMNLPRLLPALEATGLSNPIVCANVNKIGFRMSGGIDVYRTATEAFPARVIAMSVLASGAIPAAEAIEWAVQQPYVRSILFGASSERNIRSTVELIRHFDGDQAVAA